MCFRVAKQYITEEKLDMSAVIRYTDVKEKNSRRGTQWPCTWERKR